MATSSCEPQRQEYDFSNIPYPAELKTYSSKEIGIKVSIGVVVDLLAIVGNILVITIVVRFKHMRTTTNYYLVNLAVSDLLVGLMPIWVHIVASLNEFWVFGSFLCKFNPFMQITAMCSSMFTLMLIAGDRFFAIMCPMKSRVTRRKVSYLLILVWALAIAIATPLLFVYYYMERQWQDVLETYCDEKWPMKELENKKCDYGLNAKKTYWIIVCAVLNWAPMVLMTLAYTFIVIKLRNHRIVPKLGAASRSTRQERSKKKVVMMLFSVLVLFIICAVPFQTIKIYFLYTQGEIGYTLPSWFHTLDFAAVLLMYSNAAINPIIYAGFNDSFRKSFKDLVKGLTGRRSPSASESFESEYKRRSELRARDAVNESTVRTRARLTNGTTGLTNGTVGLANGTARCTNVTAGSPNRTVELKNDTVEFKINGTVRLTNGTAGIGNTTTGQSNREEDLANDTAGIYDGTEVLPNNDTSRVGYGTAGSREMKVMSTEASQKLDNTTRDLMFSSRL